MCDLILEVYIVENIDTKKFLPNLKTVNRVSINERDLAKRTQQKKLLALTDKIWRITNTYRLMKPGKMDEEPTFYVNDEVGNSISHSDTPNTILAPLIYSPNNEVDDSQTTTYSIFWNSKDIKKEEYLQRDYLNGVTEKQWRSARLHLWFNVYPEYFEAELKKLRDFKPAFDAKKKHDLIQVMYPAPGPIDWDV